MIMPWPKPKTMRQSTHFQMTISTSRRVSKPVPSIATAHPAQIAQRKWPHFEIRRLTMTVVGTIPAVIGIRPTPVMMGEYPLTTSKYKGI